MKVQTTKNDPIDRGDEGHSELKLRIISTWLGRRDLFQLFDDTKEVNISEIRKMLDEHNEDGEAAL